MNKPITFLRRAGKSALAVFVLTAVAGCVDNAYDLDNISKEVTIGGEEIVVPLGKLDKTIGKLLEDVEGLESGSDHIYKFVFQSGDDDDTTFTIDGFSIDPLTNLSPTIDPATIEGAKMPSQLVLAGVQENFTIDYPKISAALTGELSLQAEIPMPAGIPSVDFETTVPAMGEQSVSYSGQAVFNASFSVPQEIKQIKKVEFGGGEYGSRVDVSLNLNGLTGINDGGTLDLTISFDKKYELCDAAGNSTGNTYTVSGYRFGAGTSAIPLTFYLHALDLSAVSVSGGKITLADNIDYSLNLSFDTRSGLLKPEAPQFVFKADPVYDDMQIVTNKIAVNQGSGNTINMDYVFNGIPESVSKVDLIAFEEAPVTLSLEGLDWLDGSLLDASIQFPSTFTFADHALLNKSTNTVNAAIAEFKKGITLSLKSINTSNSTIANGQLSVSAKVVFNTGDIDNGMEVLLSQIQAKTSPVTVTAVVEQSNVKIDAEAGRITLKASTYDFHLGEENAPRITQDIDIPSEVKSVSALSIASAANRSKPAGATLSLTMRNAAKFPIADGVNLNFDIFLPKIFKPLKSSHIQQGDNGDYRIHIGEKWNPRQTPVFTVSDIQFDAIENLPAIVDGVMHLDEAFVVTGGITVPDGTGSNFDFEDITVDIAITIDDIAVTAFTGIVDAHAEVEPAEISLGDLSDLGLTIHNFAISPIITLNISDNATGIPFAADLHLTTFDSEGNRTANTLDITDITVSNKRGEQTIVLSTEGRRSNYGSDVTFVPVDFARLFKGGIPSQIELAATLRTDASSECNIDLGISEYTIDYDYSVEIPLEFESGFNIAYSHEVEDLSAEIGSLDGIKVKRAAIVANFETDIPVDLGLYAQALGADGSRLETISLATDGTRNTVKGSADGSMTKSTVVIGLDIPDGDLGHIGELEVLQFTFTLKNDSDSTTALKDDQRLKATLKLHIYDGITADLDKLLSENDEE